MEAKIPWETEFCQFELEFSFPLDGEEYIFPSLLPNLPNTRFAFFGLLNVPNTNFQTFKIPMKMDFINFNWFTGTQSKLVKKICESEFLFD